jgi:NADH-quinone oxidoreductase subunit D
MGPQHPATHGVLRVILRLDGEKVMGSECVIGYLHRGVEKIAENRTYTMFNPYVDRMDYVAAVSNGLGYCEAVEKLLNVEAPPRAQYIRVILTELNRIASHQLWLGTHALDIGALTPLFYTFRDREEILKIFEKYCGARLTTHAFRIGGLQYEAYDGFEKDVKNFVRSSAEDRRIRRAAHHESHLAGAHQGRRQSSPERLHRARRHRAGAARQRREVGPAQGQPYAATRISISKFPPGQNGDTYDRYLVRMARCGNRCASSSRRSMGFPKARSWRKFRR